MTREEAIALARDYVRRLGQAVCLEPDSARYMESEPFNELLGRRFYPGNFWAVEFPKRLPPGVTECPGSVLVEVMEATGQVREVVLGWTIPRDGTEGT